VAGRHRHHRRRRHRRRDADLTRIRAAGTKRTERSSSQHGHARRPRRARRPRTGSIIAHTQHRDLTVIGGSAGAIGVLRRLLAGLAPDYPAAIFAVVHLAPDVPSLLPQILGRDSALPVMLARHGAPILPGTVTVAPPNLHLALERDGCIVVHGPRENQHRPSIDVLFRSAAVVFGPRVTGVVLSGMLDDGAAGLWAIERRGGATVVQDPDDAEYPDMPRHALERVPGAKRIGVAHLAALLARSSAEPATFPAPAAPAAMQKEVALATKEDSTMEDLDDLGTRVPFTCPECGGTLWEVSEDATRFRCHVGHAYSLRTLAAEQGTQLEAALWAALRRLEESERISERMAHQARVHGNASSARYHEDVSRSTAHHAEVLRGLLASITDRAADVPQEG